ncbi:glycosyltransferase [Rhodopseudomonas parapalustris]
MNDVNTQSYWSHRFIEDWEQRGGRHQSRAFAGLALQNMPAWLVSAIRSNRLRVLDWGCALGDGTDLLRSALNTELTGIDFARPAVEQARLRYPLCKFDCVDISATPLPHVWDVIFSSNTLEHFADPWATAEKLAAFAGSALVVLVPYREIERYCEHEYTFLAENIPTVLDSLQLAHCSVLDASVEPAAMWNGQQVLLVYVTAAFARALYLSDISIAPDIAALRRANEELTRLTAERECAVLALEAQAGELATIRNSLISEAETNRVTTAELQAVKQANADLNARLLSALSDCNDWEYLAKAVVGSTSWKATQPFRWLSTAARLLISNPRATGKRISYFVRLVRAGGVGRAFGWIRERLSQEYGPRTTASTAKPLLGIVDERRIESPVFEAKQQTAAFELIRQAFNPYELIEPLKPIRVDVVEEPFCGNLLPFSCVTTVRDEAPSIIRFLESLANQSSLPRELIFVDGGSSDNTVKLAREWGASAPIDVTIVEAGRVNIARGRNIGVQRVSTDLIAFVDAGTVLQANFFQELIGAFTTFDTLDAACGLYEASESNAHSKQFIWDFDNIDLKNFLPSARALAVTKATFQRTHGFPEYLTKTGEDTSFALELRRVSRNWAVCRLARVVWNAPVEAAQSKRLMYNYAYGDGESAFGDFNAYSHVLAKNASSTWLTHEWVNGYIAGRLHRSAVEVERRGIRKIVIILSGVPFTDSGGGQRCSQMAIAFARKNCKVVFVNIYPSFEEKKKIYFDVDLSLFEFYALKDFNPNEIADRYGQFDVRVSVISEFPHPSLLPVIEALKSRFRERVTTIYDYIDNWETSLGWEWYSQSVERRFIEQADVLVASAKTLQQKLSEASKREVALIPNAVNDRIFDRSSVFARPADLPVGRMIVIYTGAMWGEWFDWELLSYCAAQLPDFDFVLIGGADPARQDSISATFENVHFLGVKPQRDLPAYLAHAEAGVIPFVPGNVTHFVNPLKVYEYVAMGLPVVSTNMKEIAGIPGVSMASTAHEFATAVKVSANTRPPVDEMIRFAKLNNWDARVELFIEIIEPTSYQQRSAS